MNYILNNEIMFFNVSGISVFISFLLYSFIFLNSKATLLKKLATFSLMISLFTLTVALVSRGLALNFFPLTNLYESLLMLAWAIIFAYILLEWKLGINSLGWVVSGLLLAVYTFATWLPDSQKGIAPLVPALQSYWRLIHVPPLIMSYALFIIGAISSIAYLIEYYKAQKKQPDEQPKIDNLSADDIQGIEIQMQMGISGVSPKAQFYDEVTYRCISIAFPLLTIGIIMGALWANHAWGALWQWDPKETMALVTFFVYAIYLHFRLNVNSSPKALAYISIVGMLMVYLTYLGVNLYDFGGLHSYGKLDS